MVDKTPENPEEQDSAYNPSEIHAAEQFGGDSQSTEDQQSKTPEDKSSSSQEDLKDKEETPDQIPFTGSGAGPKKQPLIGKLLGSAKKNSAITAIVGLLLTGAFGLSLLSPSLLLMQFRETLLDKFNDQLTAMDFRQTAILKKKLGKTTLDGCTLTSIRCKYKTLGDRHIKRLSAAGIEVEGNSTIITGRTKPTSFVYNGESIAAENLLNRARSDPGLRSAMRHGYNPKFAAFSDAVANKVIAKLGLKKTKTITPSSDKEKMKEELKATASGDVESFDGKKLDPVTKDGEVIGYTDEAGNSYTVQEGNSINSTIDEVAGRGELADGIGKAALKSGLKSALTVTALGYGAVDSACSVWLLIRVAGFAAKLYGQRQLIRYAYEFMKTPDGLRANAVEPLEKQITPEEVEFFSDILTSTNSEGESATDSDGYRYAAYGDVFNPGNFDTDLSDQDATTAKNEVQNETARYVNGQIIPDNAMASIVKAVNGGSSGSVSTADSVCKFTKSWKGQTLLIGLAVVGAVVGFFTGGVSVGAGTAAAATVSIAASVALAAFTPKLQDMAKGQLITGEENGNEAGNAATSGVGGLNAQMAQGRALPVLDKQDAVEYNKLAQTTAADYNEVDRYERGPFDPTSKNTFIGGVVNSLLPYTTKMSNGGATVTSTASLVSQSIGNLLSPKSSAATTTAEEFNSCDDPEYESLAADPFCNLRYGMSMEALAKDPEEVLNYMIKGGYVTEDDANPQGEYANYIKQCIERENSIGDNLSSGDEGDGKNCIQGKSGENEERNTMFRLFYIDQSIQEGMDSDFGSVPEGTPTGEAETFTVGTYNTLNADGHTPESVAIAGPTCNRADDRTCAKARAATQAKLILGESDKYPEPMDIIGTQETAPSQYRQLLKNLPTYAGVPSDDKNIERMTQQQNGGVSIIWNTEKFTKFEEGYAPALSNVADKENNGEITSPWVGLQTKSGRKVYVTSIHYPVENYSDPELGDKGTLEKGMKLTLDWANEKAKLGTVIITGDFNDHTPEKTTYCGFTKTGLFQNTHDMAKGDSPEKPCPNPTPDFGIDHIYVSTNQELTAKSWTRMPKLKEASAQVKAENPMIYQASDHSPITVELSFPGTSVEGNLNVGTYNVRTSTLNNKEFGDPDKVYDAEDEERMKGAAGVISSRQLQIVGVQEARKAERKGLTTYLPDYYEGTEVMETAHELESMVFWDNRYFKQVDFGTYTIPKNPGVLREGMWVKLQSLNTGGEVYVFNMHAATDNDGLRADAANILLKEMDRVVGSSKTPVIVFGDMNSNDKAPDRNAVFEVFKASGKLNYARNSATQKINVHCDTENGPEDGKQDCRGKGTTGSHIDHIWISKNSNIKVNSWENIATAEMLKYSDHNPVIASLTAPSLLQLASGGGSSEGWVWPTIGPITDGPCYGVTNRYGNHAGMDINTPSTTLKVLAMHDGTVEQKGTDRAAGNYIMIKATDGTYYAYQHLKSLPTVSGQVKAGQEIGIAGTTGRFDGSSAGHLHITMATRATLGSYSGHPDNFDPMTKLKAVKPGGYNCTN